MTGVDLSPEMVKAARAGGTPTYVVADIVDYAAEYEGGQPRCRLPSTRASGTSSTGARRCKRPRSCSPRRTRGDHAPARRGVRGRAPRARRASVVPAGLLRALLDMEELGAEEAPLTPAFVEDARPTLPSSRRGLKQPSSCSNGRATGPRRPSRPRRVNHCVALGGIGRRPPSGSPPRYSSNQRRRARSLAVSQSAPICALRASIPSNFISGRMKATISNAKHIAIEVRPVVVQEMRLDELRGLLLALERRRDAHVHDGPLRLRGLRRLVERRIYTFFSKSPRTSLMMSESKFAVAKPSFLPPRPYPFATGPRTAKRRSHCCHSPAAAWRRVGGRQAVGGCSATAQASTMESLVIILCPRTLRV